jgi:FKBP-type peptidyl-prolyl cis-trans isomerase SlyD
VRVGEDQVTLDGNHPLAGVTLNFDITVQSVRDATSEELEHGHVHP